MNKTTLALASHKPIASGNNRDVFAHPENPEWVIKTSKARAWASNPDLPWRKRLFRRYRYYNTFLRECQEHIVGRLDGQPAPTFLHTVIGFVDTDLGLGLVTRAERDRSGAYAKTLLQLIKDGEYDAEAQAAFKRFIADFLASDVIITDLGMKNILYAYGNDLGFHFVAIDGFGEKNILPFNSLFRFCNQRSKQKRIKRLGLAVQAAVERYSSPQV